MRFRFYYAGIRVRDLRRSVSFYTKAVGMRVVAQGTMPHGGRWAHLKGPGSPQTLELNWYPRGSRFYAPYRRGEEMDHLAFRVGNVERAFAHLVKHGAASAVPPDKSEGTEVYVKDPDGIWIELLG